VPEVHAPSSSAQELFEKNNLKTKTGGAEIEFKNLNFFYPGTDPSSLVLKNINLKIKPKEKVAFVGSIGSGKSTLLCLLPRIYSVPKGKIFVNGMDINEWPLEVLREWIGFVPQDHFLFSESVFQNIVFGVPGKNFSAYSQVFSEVEKLTEACAVREDILGLTDKFETKLGERGVNLSGGQKQRLSIARALMKKPKILILDDSLSAVDTETENKLLGAVLREQGEMTQLISAHRISTVKKADRIIVLEKGEIKAEGTHKELIRDKKSLYYKFYEQQKLKDEILEWSKKEIQA